MFQRLAILAFLAVLGASRAGFGQERDTLDKATAERVFQKKPYSPYVGQTYPTHVYFGDTHVHTSQSLDAVMFGTRLGPEEAYRLARGEEVISSTGQRLQLSRRTCMQC